MFVNCCDKLRKIEGLPLKTIQRVVSPYCKTQYLGDTIHLKLKGHPYGISIRYLNESVLLPCPYYRVTTRDTKKTFDISAVDLNELMKKINHIYKFTYPYHL